MRRIIAFLAIAVSLASFAERDTAIYRGKLTSDLNVNGNRVTNAAPPVAAGDLANKAYVDSHAGDVDTNAVRDIVRDTLATNGIRSVDGAARPLPKYLHIYNADDSYTEAAEEYYRSRGNGKTDGGCSAVRSGGYLSRNFDFPFDDRAEFVVRMSAGPGRFASVGVAQVGTNLTEQMVTSGKPEYSRIYKWLPGATVDGINENGVACNINVVDGDPQTSGWHTTGNLHPLAAVRWVLDHAMNAQHGAEYIAANIHFPEGWGQNFHYMIADKTSTYIVENGEFYRAGLYDLIKPILTNFRVVGMQEGPGIERYNILLDGGNITNVWYTNAYRRETNPPWVSDLAEVLAYTNEIFDAWASNQKEYFRNKTNGGEPWWQTVHTSVYDLDNLILKIAVQEIPDWYVFAVPTSGKVKSVNGKVGEVTLHADDVCALPDDQAQLEANENFRGAVATVSPPVELPEKWALANVSNAQGQAVNANDVGTLTRKEIENNVAPSLTIAGTLTWSANTVYSKGQIVIYVSRDGIGDINTGLYESNYNNNRGHIPEDSEVYWTPRYSLLDIIKDDYARKEEAVPTSRKINGQPLTQDITIEGMPTTGLVWNATAGKVKTANGAKEIGAADVGALRSVDGFYGPSSYHFQFVMTNNLSFAGIDMIPGYAPQTLVRIADDGYEKIYTVYGGMYITDGITVYNFVKDYATGEYAYDGHAYMRMNPFMDNGFTIERYNGLGERSMASLPQTQFEGVFAIQDWSSLSAMLADANTSTNADCECISTNICKLIQPELNRTVNANLNTYIDGETGVEYKGKWYGGSMYYVPTGNVYPPNN